MTTTIIDVKPPSEKAKQSEDINAHIEAFLAKGGKIDVKESVSEYGVHSKASFSEY